MKVCDLYCIRRRTRNCIRLDGDVAAITSLITKTIQRKLIEIALSKNKYQITVTKRNFRCEEEEQFPSYTLTFNIEFPHTDDAVYIAHCYPYTYSDLQEYLSRLQSHPIKSTYSKLRLLCRTLAGNNVYYLTITAPPNPNDIDPRVSVISIKIINFMKESVINKPLVFNNKCNTKVYIAEKEGSSHFS